MRHPDHHTTKLIQMVIVEDKISKQKAFDTNRFFSIKQNQGKIHNIQNIIKRYKILI